MALLLSEDENVLSSFEFNFLREHIKKKPELCWIPYQLNLKSGCNSLSFKSLPENLKIQSAGDYVLAIEPVNEIEKLIQGINEVLKNERNLFSFEPLEPSFELIVEKSHNGFSINIWVDSGNVISNHYSWDGFGIRFFTTEENLIKFVAQLNAELKELLYA